MGKDYYVVLGVSKKADTRKIKRAYREAIKRYHPDVARTPESTERFLEATEAYETLVDADKRRKYDQALARQARGPRFSSAPGVARAGRPVSDPMDVFFTAGETTAESLFTGRRGSLPPGSPEKNLYFDLILSPAEAEKGGSVPVHLPVREVCPRCRHALFVERLFCPLCRGTGQLRGRRRFSLHFPPRLQHGAILRIGLDALGLQDIRLNVRVVIDRRS